MKDRTVTHEIVVTDPNTGESVTTRQDYSEYKTQCPNRWDEFARATMAPFVEALQSKGYQVKVLTK